MDSYRLLSTTRWDPLLLTLRWNYDRQTREPSPYLLLGLHFDRLIAGAEKHGWHAVKAELTPEKLRDACDQAVESFSSEHGQSPQSLRLRVLLQDSGELQVTASPIPPLSSDPTDASFFIPSDNPSRFAPLQSICVDTQHTPASIFTTTKTTHRPMYNEARARCGVPPVGTKSTDGQPDDVLIYNKNGSIMETSIANIALFQKGWITPPLSTGCLPGVMRRWLLEQGRIREVQGDNHLFKDKLAVGDWVLLFNGLQGCRLGRIAHL